MKQFIVIHHNGSLFVEAVRAESRNEAMAKVARSGFSTLVLEEDEAKSLAEFILQTVKL